MTDVKVTNSHDLEAHPIPEVREAQDAEDHDALKGDPGNEDAVADIASDESFPASDPPSHTATGGGEPAPSSGYDEEAERALSKDRADEESREALVSEPLAYGADRNAGAFMAGSAPDDASENDNEPRRPLDARTHFGGDGAQYSAPDEPRPDMNVEARARRSAVGPSDDGYDAGASRPTSLDID